MSDYIDRTIGDLWFVFGDHGNGCVDLNNGTDDIFTHITKEQAEKLVEIRATFLREVREVYETMPRLGCDQSPTGAGMLRLPGHAWESFHENAPRWCPRCDQYEIKGVGRCLTPEEAYEKSNRAQAPEDQRD